MRAVPETGSTNADLLAEGAAGAPDRSVLRADHQTAGRGRRDRTWEAPPGAHRHVSVRFRAG
ncbi:MAG: biotin--[acetyl-CoA-carboxylase] ligase, partial [Actinomycetes bacterium]